jgi:purine-binding chemotaxis protein CheW
MSERGSWGPDDLAILEARTRSLAGPLPDHAPSSTFQVLVLRVGAERYGLPTDAAHGVAALSRLSPLPHAPPEVAGLTAIGGDILPAFYLRAVLGLALTSLPEYARIVLLGEGQDRLALVVDAVDGMRAVEPASVRPAPPTLSPAAAALVSGVDVEGLPILDPRGLLASNRLVVDVPTPAA